MWKNYREYDEDPYGKSDMLYSITGIGLGTVR